MGMRSGLLSMELGPARGREAHDDTAPLSRLQPAATAVATPSLAHDDTVPPSGLQGAKVMFEALADKTIYFQYK